MMKVSKKLLAKYDHPHTVAVVSLYPKRGEVYSAGASGVASYTKNVVRELKQPALIIAEQAETGRPSRAVYEEGRTLVTRSWQTNHPKMWLEVLSVLRQFRRIQSLLIHFDFSMYGGMVTTGLMLPFLVLCRLMGLSVTVVSHHVIKDVRKLSGQVGLGRGINDALKAAIYNFLFQSFYWLMGKTASKVVVLEEPLKARLKDVIAEDKLEIIPHAVDNHLKIPTKAKARQRLGYQPDETIVMFFGYVNWFKGADFFAEAVKDIKTLNGKKIRFVMAGGESPTMKNKPFYQEFYQQVVQTVEQNDNLQLTGYVPQHQLADYFAAADLVVFPYREFMCASGVMSLVFSYGKPFIISDKLGGMLSAPDFSAAMKQVGLRSMDITFLLNSQSFAEVTERVLENGLKNKLRRFTRLMRRERSFKTTASLYALVLQSAQHTQPTREDVKGALAYVAED